MSESDLLRTVQRTVLFLDRLLRHQAGIEEPAAQILMSSAIEKEMAGIVAELAAACDNDSDLDEMRREAVDRLERIRAEEVLEILGDAEIERRVEEERGQEDDGANDPTECPVCEAHHGGGTDTLLNGVCVICSYDQTVAGLGWFRRRDADLARLT